MHDRTAIAVQNATRVLERATYIIDVGNINVPVLVRMRSLLETGPATSSK
jgi:hypothetical protein